jgi:outer membrane protein assembly factor BamB
MTGEPTRRQYLGELATTAAVGLAGCRTRSDAPEDESALGPLPKLWEVTVRDAAPPTFGADGLYVSARYGHVGAGGGDVRVTALTPDGSERWRATTRDGTSGVGLGDGTAYVGSSDGRIYAVEAASGEFRWRFETGYSVRGSPTRQGDTLFVGSRDDRLYALGIDGTERWTVEVGNDVDAGPAVAGSQVYAGSDDYIIYARDTATGSTAWRHEGRAPVTALAVGGGTVYTGTDKGTIRAHDAETGEVRWSAVLGQTARRVRGLAVRDDRLYVVERSGMQAYGPTGGASE